MKIDDTFYIKRNTSVSFSLIKKSKKAESTWTKNPDELKETVTYHSSIESYLKSYARQVINESKSIADIFDKIQQLNKKIDELGIKYSDEYKA